MRIAFEAGERSVLIARCGLGPNATDNEIQAAVTRRLLAGEEPPAGTPAEDDPAQPTQNPTSSPEGDTTDRPSPEQPPAEGGGSVGGTPDSPRGTDNAPDDEDDSLNASVVTLDAEAFRSLTQRANLAAQIQETQRVQTRDNLIEAAIRDGRFPPGRRQHYQAAYDSDPEATQRAINRMARNVVPLEARGVEANEEEVDTTSYPKDWISGGFATQPAPAPATNGSGRGMSRIHTED